MKLTEQLSKKVKIIQRSKQSKTAGTRQFYEANLTNMDDATMQGMELENMINNVQTGVHVGQGSANSSEEEESPSRVMLN